MKRHIASVVTAVPLVLFARETSAQTASGNAGSSLEEVVVVANRAPEPLSRVGNSVTVLTDDDIKQSQATVASDLLQQTPGITVARTGGVGQPTSVFIRGAEGDHGVLAFGVHD